MKKILVLDDDVEILYVLGLILTDNHYVVKTTPQWFGISDTIDAFVPDLILMDIDLNGADGGEICRELKRSKINEDIPIILISAFDMPQKYISESNAQGFIHKPFVTKIMVDTIAHHLNNTASN